MQHVNGNTMQVDPKQAAMFGLQFLENVSHTRAQREMYDMAVGLLQAIATGQLVLAPAPNAPVVAPQPETQQ